VGEILALLGPSGCGKSTLLRAIAGLETLDAGSIETLAGLDPEHAVGIAFQQPSLLPWLSVSGNIGLGLRFAANRASDPGEAVARTITQLDLEAVSDAYPDELSGGQAQRANVARVIVTGRPILLLDEPFAALDPGTRSSLQQWLIDLRRSHGLTIVIVTYDVSEALRLGDRVALMSGAPGTIQRVWNVDDAREARRGTTLADLHDEILKHYDTDQSPVDVAALALAEGSTSDHLEGAV